jgi:hypothetical protein
MKTTNLRKQEGTATQSVSQLDASIQPSQQEIAALAYELFLARGAGPGSDLEDWLQAERELIEKRKDSAWMEALALR